MTHQPYTVIITPPSASETVWKEHRCIYSVSIGAANRTVEDVRDGLVWTKNRFPQVAVLVGDSLYAVTLRIQEGLDEAGALAKALTTSNEAVGLLEQKADTIEILRTSRIASDPTFIDIETQLEAGHESTPAFAKSIDADATLFVRRQARNKRLALRVEEAESLSRRYLIREMATYAYLASLGWRVDAYLGLELPTLARILAGTVPAISSHLAERINISLIRKDLP